MMDPLELPFEQRGVASARLAPSKALPIYLVAHPSRTGLVRKLVDGLGAQAVDEKSAHHSDVRDDFLFHHGTGDVTSSAATQDLGRTTFDVLLPGSDTGRPQADATPLFSLERYFAELDESRRQVTGSARGSGITDEQDPDLGDVMFYCEAVSSTQTMLQENLRLLRSIPTPFVSLATFQLQGRGRGSNTWASPAGCLQHSLVLTLPPSFPPTKLVFVQYLFAMAVCDALDESGKLGIRIKWPNDIYAEAEGLGGQVQPNGKGRLKIGGILVNTSYIDGQWKVIVGTGINIFNAEPTTCVAQLYAMARDRLVQQERDTAVIGQPPTMEGSLARIFATFQPMWERFVADKGFDSFLDEYLGRWLHSNQIVTLGGETPSEKLQIKTINLEDGFLRCVRVKGASGGRRDDGSEDRTATWMPTSSGSRATNIDYIDLQPDGNSFDMMQGMIRKKQ